MKLIKDQKFGGERPLFAAHDLRLENVTITDVKVRCDGIQLKIDDTGSTPYEDGVIYDFFDSYDPSGNNESVYDFSGKNTIEISFTITGAKIK